MRFDRLGNFFGQLIGKNKPDKNTHPPAEEQAIPKQKIEQKESGYSLNLNTNYKLVFDRMKALEGETWAEKQQEQRGSDAPLDSFFGALYALREGKKVEGIYGAGGVHRFFVKDNGDVVYSRSHGSAKVEQALALGFIVE